MPLRSLAILMAAILGLGGLLIADPAQAKLAVNKNIIEIGPNGQPRADIELSNRGDDVLYITITPARIDNPGHTNEARETSANPRDLGLMATPRRLILKPGDRQLVRLVLMKRPKDKDEIFRLHIDPKISDFENPNKGMQVKILIAYDLLVIARPPDANPNLETDRKGKTLTLINKGNSNVLVYDGQQCDAQGGNCKNLPTKRLYAGATHNMTLHYADTPVRFLLEDGTTNQAVEY